MDGKLSERHGETSLFDIYLRLCTVTATIHLSLCRHPNKARR
ncbi:hypothetical protein OU5_1353 [Pseudomonas mandelii JR-1]|uniref:Uncharacterized protein n=1 Tax=Pseudomonas mandelii JR-1 TaxID=1147786 RepID=A0A024E6J7_9PSED|nr:hypothetical protein OU5_1353 [Pseudomonas mandelii JR-1]